MASAIAGARAYDEERERAERLAELDRAKTLFFTNVSHELRTPLTLLLGPAEDALLDTDAALNERQRARLDVINRNAQRLLRLVNTLLDFSRLESGQAVGRFAPVDRHGSIPITSGSTDRIDCPCYPCRCRSNSGRRGSLTS